MRGGVDVIMIRNMTTTATTLMGKSGGGRVLRGIGVSEGRHCCWVGFLLFLGFLCCFNLGFGFQSRLLV